jgi:hypothetical protein
VIKRAAFDFRAREEEAAAAPYQTVVVRGPQREFVPLPFTPLAINSSGTIAGIGGSKVPFVTHDINGTIKGSVSLPNPYADYPHEINKYGIMVGFHTLWRPVTAGSGTNCANGYCAYSLTQNAPVYAV